MTQVGGERKEARKKQDKDNEREKKVEQKKENGCREKAVDTRGKYGQEGGKGQRQ